jgi:hypothetical protein
MSGLPQKRPNGGHSKTVETCQKEMFVIVVNTPWAAQATDDYLEARPEHLTSAFRHRSDEETKRSAQ